jgi:hypothetical protein
MEKRRYGNHIGFTVTRMRGPGLGWPVKGSRQSEAKWSMESPPCTETPTAREGKADWRLAIFRRKTYLGLIAIVDLLRR